MACIFVLKSGTVAGCIGKWVRGHLVVNRLKAQSPYFSMTACVVRGCRLKAFHKERLSVCSGHGSKVEALRDAGADLKRWKPDLKGDFER